MTKIDRESVEQAWEAIHDAALMRHKDGGAELARLVINADDAFEALAAERDRLARIVQAAEKLAYAMPSWMVAMSDWNAGGEAALAEMDTLLSAYNAAVEGGE